MSDPLRIGEVAARAGVRADTVRYYEKRGLIPPPQRRPSGYRAFAAETVQRIRFIKRAQELGFTLEEIAQLLRLRASRRAECGDVREIADHKIEIIDQKITDLRAIRGALKHLLDGCHGNLPVIECPIIESLERSAGA